MTDAQAWDTRYAGRDLLWSTQPNHFLSSSTINHSAMVGRDQLTNRYQSHSQSGPTSPGSGYKPCT
jgi:hypothetical protein